MLKSMMHFATSPPVSPESDRSKAKPNITRSNLRKHGIEYDSKILGTYAADGTANGRLPQGIIGFGELLSDFTRELIHQDREQFLEDDLSDAMKRQDFAEIVDGDSWCLLPPKSAFWNRVHPDDDDKDLKIAVSKQIDECRKIAEKAIGMRDRSEHDWTLFLRQHLFRNFESTKRMRKAVE
jgi:hypothetical protein